MKIAIDYRMVGQHAGGMAVYVKTVTAALKTMDHKNDYFLIDDKYRPAAGFWGAISWVIHEQFWQQVTVQKLFKLNNYDQGLFPNPPVPFLLNKPIILTIADMSFYYDKGIMWWARWYLWLIYFISAHKAKKIITFSQNSKQDIVKTLRIDGHKIQVIPLAPAKEIKRTDEKLYIENPYIMAFPGTFIPRKNVHDLLISFRDVLKIMTGNFKLVLVGENESQGYKDCVLEINKLGLQDNVMFAGRISYEELSRWYSRAVIFVCTSLYEGFGLPILEAMKCGAPVISYENSSLPEVVGKAGILVNNHTELSKAIMRVLKSRRLQNTMKRNGLKRAAYYSWEKTAAAVLTTLC